MAKQSFSSVDFQALAAEVEEARAILARKAELELEIKQEEKHLDRLRSEYAAVETELENTRGEAAQARDRFEYERTRLANDLHEHAQQCEETKRVNEKNAQALLARFDAENKQHQDKAAGEKRALEAEVAGLRAVRDALRKELTDFRTRIGSLLA